MIILENKYRDENEIENYLQGGHVPKNCVGVYG